MWQAMNERLYGQISAKKADEDKADEQKTDASHSGRQNETSPKD
jgi:hypothetical protein